MHCIEESKKLLKKTIKSIERVGGRQTLKKIVSHLSNGYYIPNIKDGFSEKMQKNGYFNLYQKDVNFIVKPKVKAMAFYLPQYHTFPENDKWWGKGFTEWTNTKKSAPRYRGHYQPREPHDDIGYYDLSNVETLKKQALLARQHGIYGFCIYYYWFSGKKLMEKPLDLLLVHPEIDINYCLCWANESWTRTWDGLNENVLIQQKYEREDPLNFINDIRKYVNDKRYIKHSNRPVIVVYNPGDIPDVERVFNEWKDISKKNGIGDISIWICKSFQNSIKALHLEGLVDKEIEFPPHNFGNLPIAANDPQIHLRDSYVFDYSRLVDYLLCHRSDDNYNNSLCRTVMLGWDNSARRAKGFNSFDNFNIAKYYQWLRSNVDETANRHEQSDRYVFINAWNEWAEGTYLEPDKKYGYSYLNVTTQALNQSNFCLERVIKKDGEKACRIALQVHIFYVELVDEIINYINNISEPYDCYVTTDDAYKAEQIISSFQTKCNAKKIVVTVYENRGRDVGPFLIQLQAVAKNYSYICHIHSKRSLHNFVGEKWRTYLLSNLLGSPQIIKQIITYFDKNKDIGLIYPQVFKDLLDFYEWGSNKDITKMLLNKINVTADLDYKLDFPVGNMLWFRVEAVFQLFDEHIVLDDFPKEAGQMDGTLMHAIERVWNYLARSNGYKHQFMNISNIEDRF